MRRRNLHLLWFVSLSDGFANGLCGRGLDDGHAHWFGGKEGCLGFLFGVVCAAAFGVLGWVGGLSVVEFGCGGVGWGGTGFGVFGVEGVFFGGEGEGLLADWLFGGVVAWGRLLLG
jgi:hypothetical protein